MIYVPRKNPATNTNKAHSLLHGLSCNCNISISPLMNMNYNIQIVADFFRINSYDFYITKTKY